MLFQVLMSSDSNGIALSDVKRCAIFITDDDNVNGLVFPVDPVVVSLKSYDSASENTAILNGYPVICVTVSLTFS